MSRNRARQDANILFLLSPDQEELDIMMRRAKMALMSEELPHTQDVCDLYRRAFDEFGARALWNVRRQEEPTCADALAITRALRVEGNLAARRLAEQIEQACRGAF